MLLFIEYINDHDSTYVLICTSMTDKKRSLLLYSIRWDGSG